ncbi:MAG: hypothetical protein JO353_07185, partial [Phycisphaerae bacterium]|nr:hypothetical protein [Phycisphaerae bacterium]
NGVYTVSIGSDAVEDMDGNASVAATLGSFRVAIPKAHAGATGPTATLRATDLTDTTTTSEPLIVTYQGASPISTNTLDDNDILVTGPDGYSQNPTFISSTVNSDGSITATYSLYVGINYYPLAATALASSAQLSTVSAGSGGSLKAQIIFPPFGGKVVNGAYTVSLVADQVNDLRGISAAATTLGTFNVNRAATPTPVGPIELDTSTISAITAGSSKNVDAHHLTLASIASTSPKTSPTRIHTNLPKRKHKKHKSHHTVSVKPRANHTP